MQAGVGAKRLHVGRTVVSLLVLVTHEAESSWTKVFLNGIDVVQAELAEVTRVTAAATHVGVATAASTAEAVTGSSVVATHVAKVHHALLTTVTTTTVGVVSNVGALALKLHLDSLAVRSVANGREDGTDQLDQLQVSAAV